MVYNSLEPTVGSVASHPQYHLMTWNFSEAFHCNINNYLSLKTVTDEGYTYCNQDDELIPQNSLILYWGKRIILMA